MKKSSVFFKERTNTFCFCSLILTLRRSAVLFYLLLFSSTVLSADIAGVWKHEKQPVWIEVQLDQHNAIVVRNEQFPERVGNIFIKNLKSGDAKKAVWHGTAYIPKLEDHKDVELSLSESGKLQVTAKVGFFSRTVEWLPADKLAKSPE